MQNPGNVVANASRLFHHVFSLMPNSLQSLLLRSRLDLNYAPPAERVFKLAETRTELEQALTIIGKGTSGQECLAVTKYHALPSTAVLIAKENDVVVATLTLIGDNPLKLPSDAL